MFESFRSKRKGEPLPYIHGETDPAEIVPDVDGPDEVSEVAAGGRANERRRTIGMGRDAQSRKRITNAERNGAETARIDDPEKIGRRTRVASRPETRSDEPDESEPVIQEFENPHSLINLAKEAGAGITAITYGELFGETEKNAAQIKSYMERLGSISSDATSERRAIDNAFSLYLENNTPTEEEFADLLRQVYRIASRDTSADMRLAHLTDTLVKVLKLPIELIN